MFGLNVPNRGIEIQNYDADTGEKDYMYEYQNSNIKNLGNAVNYNDNFWVVFYTNSTDNNSYILKMSKTRRVVYVSTIQNSLISMAFPGDHPAFVGFTPLNEPYMIQLNDTTLESIWQLKVTSFNSNYMSLNSKSDSQNMLWALSDVTEHKLYISYLNANSSLILWTNSYVTGVTNITIGFAPVFEEYVILYLDTANSKN